MKRLFDIVLAVVGLMVSAPLMAAISAIVWLESPGNVIFSQERLGLYGKRFRMHKFRKFPAHWGDCGPGVTVSCDARMTRIGTVLERLKLDELPQLWNILKGEMSFVGPRPESVRFADLFKGRYTAVLEFIPGIFGPNQIAFRNECTLYPHDEEPEAYYRRVLFPKKAQSDLDYFSDANLLKDTGWIIRGIWASIFGIVDWARFIRLNVIILLTDIVIIMSAWTLAHFLRFSRLPTGLGFEAYLSGLWIFSLVLICAMFAGGCYRHPSHCFSLPDASRLSVIVTIAFLGSSLILFGVYRYISLYLAPMFWFILMPSLILPRAFSRIKWEKKQVCTAETKSKVILYGAGARGTALAKWIGNGSMVGFLDDDPNLRGRHVYGYRILGRESDIVTVHAVYGFNELWVTFSPNSWKRARLQQICEKCNIRLCIIPDLDPFSRLMQPEHLLASDSRCSF